MNELKRIAEFQSALKDYHLSDAARRTLTETKLVFLVGPTSSGRNTLDTELVKTGYYYHLISDTTREIRTKDGVPIEKNGREYWFRKEDELLAELRHGKFLEAAIIHEQQVSGISIREVERAHDAGLIAVTDLETTGAATIHGLTDSAQFIFVLPPNFDVWMARLRNRADLPEDEIRRRLESSHREIDVALKSDFYTFVVNLDLEKAVQDIDAIVRLGKFNAAKQHAARELAVQLRREVARYLNPSKELSEVL